MIVEVQRFKVSGVTRTQSALKTCSNWRRLGWTHWR